MIPVQQTKCSVTGVGGNCLAASLASVLELALSDVPEFETMQRSEWKDNLRQWAKELGFCVSFETTAPPGYTVSVGRQLSGILHAVVAFNGSPYFDPHPAKTFYNEHCYFICLAPA